MDMDPPKNDMFSVLYTISLLDTHCSFFMYLWVSNEIVWTENTLIKKAGVEITCVSLGLRPAACSLETTQVIFISQPSLDETPLTR